MKKDVSNLTPTPDELLCFLKPLRIQWFFSFLVLWFSMSTRRGEYDLSRIKLKGMWIIKSHVVWMRFISLSIAHSLESLPGTEISGDVVVHMTKQMTRLSKRMQSKLKCCACLGPCFDTEILRKAIRETDANIDSFLESSLEDGFFQHVADNRYKWTHDQIQQAAYGSYTFLNVSWLSNYPCLNITCLGL